MHNVRLARLAGTRTSYSLMYEDGDHLRWEIYVKSGWACEDAGLFLLRKAIFCDYFDFDTLDFHRSNIEFMGFFSLHNFREFNTHSTKFTSFLMK